MRFQPNETDKARYNQKYRYEERAAFITHIRKKPQLRKRLPRSSYAFAQQSGWGHLITSGIMQVKRQPYARASHDANVCLFVFSFLVYFYVFFFITDIRRKKSNTYIRTTKICRNVITKMIIEMEE